MSQISRRKFLELTMAGAMGTVLAACAGQEGQVTPSASPSPAGPLATATRIRGKPVQNENRRDRNVRYFQRFVPPTPETWQLAVGGLISNPLVLSFADMQQLPVVEQVSRMKCVECWSFKARWGGFEMASLLEQVRPFNVATHIRLQCGDAYWEVHSIEELLRDRVVFAYRMDGEFLADEYGSPLRLIVPWKYGYKGAKCITAINFVDSQGSGYWSTVGPYTVSGDIEEGYDHPQETGELVRITEAGVELTY
jgi:DMSO/TMAO reductase YedYZ molybdopterin-dependent catalytic subunit